MAENLEQQAQQEPQKPKKGFITAPTQDELKPPYDEMMILRLLQESGEAAAKSRRILGEPQQTQTFITAPTAEQLQPTPREQALLRNLCDWNEQSLKSLSYLEFDTYVLQ